MENETVKISMKLINPFPNHPFYVFDDEEMYDLTESIRKYGLITPIIVRRKQERFELISGHRRVHACRNLGHSEIACHVIEASDDEAIIMMVDIAEQIKSLVNGKIKYTNFGHEKYTTLRQ